MKKDKRKAQAIVETVLILGVLSTFFVNIIMGIPWKWKTDKYLCNYQGISIANYSGFLTSLQSLIFMYNYFYKTRKLINGLDIGENSG